MAANLTDLDTSLVGSMVFKFRGKRNAFEIQFQFPPRFLTDSRKGDWVEAPLRGDEPVAIYATSGAREITMKWTYIAGARGGKNGKVFSPYVISKQIQALRGYFASPYKMTLDDALIVRFKMWYHTGLNEFTCRLKNIDVNYGRALITDNGPFHGVDNSQEEKDQGGEQIGNSKRTYALRTDVTVEMRLWSKVAEGVAVEFAKEQARGRQIKGLKNVKIDLPGLGDKVPADWH